jgi:hypothetical protein
MSADGGDDPGLDVMDIFDSITGPTLACRVCGSLVSPEGEYPRAHFDWHAASNGA